MSKKKKKSVFILAAIIIIALISGISTAVYSSIESKVVIRLDDNRVWHCKNDFTDKWYVNLGPDENGANRKISFTVDLHDYLSSDEDQKASLAAPFTISIGSGNYSSDSISDITNDSNVEITKVNNRPGIFNVTFDALASYPYGDFVQVKVNFSEGNAWNIQQEEDVFNLIKDNIDPDFNVANKDEIFNQYIEGSATLKFDFREENVDKIVVEGTIRKKVIGKKESFKDELLGKDNNVAGKYTSLNFDKDSNKFEINFNTKGRYSLKITMYDKAGNSKVIDNVNFQIANTNFQMNIDNATKRGEAYYIKGLDAEIGLAESFWNSTLDDNVNYKISIEGTGEEVISGVITPSNSLISVPKDGTYTIKYSFIKWNTMGSQDDIEERVYKFIFDSTTPKALIKASGEELTFNNDNKVYLQEGKDILVSVTDTNINEETRKIEAFKGWQALESTSNESLNFKAEDEGLYVVKAKAEDYSKNKIEETYFINIDKKDPELTLSGVEDGDKFKKGHNETPTIRLKAYDDNLKEAKVKITRDSKNEPTEVIEQPLNNNSEFSYEVNKNGKYTLTATAEDMSGRRTVIETIKFERDADAPLLDIKVDDRELGWHEFNEDSMPYINNEKGIKIDAAVIEDYPKLNNDGTVDEKATYIKVERTPVDQEGNASETVESVEYFSDIKSVTLNDDGRYKVTIYSVDNCGNESERTLYFVLDRKAPDLTVTNVKAYYDNTPDIQIESKDAFQEGCLMTINYTKTIKHLDGNDEVYPDNTKEIYIDSSVKVVNLSDEEEFSDEAEYNISSIKVVDKACNISEKKDIYYIFDTEPPTKSIDGLEEGKLYYNTDRQIQIKTEDINLDTAKVTVFKNGEEYEPTEQETVKAFTIGERSAEAEYLFATDGEYKIRLESKDKSGNGEDDTKEAEFIIDKTLPDVKIEDYDSLNGAYINYDRTVKVNVTEKYLEEDTELTYVNIVKNYPDGTIEDKNYKFELNGECPNYSNIYNEFTEDAEYKVTVTAQDKAGNISVSPTLTFTVDKTVPTQTITGVENDAYYNVDKDVELVSIDNNQDINTVVVTRDGENYHVGDFTVEGIKAFLKETFSGEGTYEIVFTTTDKAGNTSISKVKFTIDKTAPDIKAIKGDDGSELKFGEYINRVFTPQFVLDNSEDYITQVTLNGADVTGNVSMASQEMEYNYTVTARDKAGNVTTIDSLFTVDTTNPEISISGIMSGFFNKDLTPEFDITDTNLDYANTSSTLNGQPFSSGTKIEDQNDFNLKLIGTDLATNSSSQSISFTIDKDGPVIKFENPISGKYFTEDFIPKFLIEDLSDYTIIALTLDGEEYHMGDVIDEEGKHVLYIEVMDKAGNKSELSIEFILDKTAPKFIIDGVTDGETYYDAMSATVMLDNPLDTINSISVNGEAADGETSDEFGQQVVKLKFNDISDYEVVLKGTDEAGNTTVQTVKFAVAEKTLLSKVTTNKKLLYSSIAAAAALSAMGVTGFTLKRRKRLKLSDAQDVEVEE